MKKYGLGIHEDAEDGDSTDGDDTEQNEIPFPFGQPLYPSEEEEELLPENHNPKKEATTVVSKTTFIEIVAGVAVVAFILMLLICICIFKCRRKGKMYSAAKDNKEEIAEETEQLLPTAGSSQQPSRLSIFSMFVHIVYAIRGNGLGRGSRSINGSKEEGDQEEVGQKEGGQEEVHQEEGGQEESGQGEETVTSASQLTLEREKRPKHPKYRRSRDVQQIIPYSRRSSSTTRPADSDISSTDIESNTQDTT